MPELLRAGGLVALVASVFDMLDGRVARLRGRETKFGAFLDSTMDRYSDMVLYMGLHDPVRARGQDRRTWSWCGWPPSAAS